MSGLSGPTRGARLLVLPRHFAHLSETDEYDAAIVCDGPLCAATQPAFRKEAYGLFHALVSACESLAAEVCDHRIDPEGRFPVGSYGIVESSLVGERVHYVRRRNGLGLYAKLAVEDRYIVALSLPWLPVAELGSLLLEAVVADLTSMPCALDGNRNAPQRSASFETQLSGNSVDWKNSFTPRAVAALEWVESILYTFTDDDKAGSSPSPTATAVWSLVSRRGLASTALFSGSVGPTHQAAAYLRLMRASTLFSSLEESVVASTSPDAGLSRWVALGGCAARDGLILASTASSSYLSRLVHLLCVRHGAVVPLRSEPESATTRIIVLDATALIDEVCRIDRTVQESVLRSAGNASSSLCGTTYDGMAVIEPDARDPLLAPAARAVLLVAHRANVYFASLYVPSTQPYQGTNLETAQRALSDAVQQLIDLGPTSPSCIMNPFGPDRLLESTISQGSTLQMLCQQHQVEVLGAACVSPNFDLRWVEIAPLAAHADAALAATLLRKRSSLDPESSAKVLAIAETQQLLCKQGLISTLLNAGVEAMRCAFSDSTVAAMGGVACPMTSVTRLLLRSEFGPTVPEEDRDLLDSLLKGTAYGKKNSRLGRHHKALKAAAIDIGATHSVPVGKAFFLASFVSSDHPGEGELRSGTCEVTAVTCLIALPDAVPAANATGIATSVVRSLGRAI